MFIVERQVHGYRQGHQLLASSVQLSKSDQSIVDQLSDVAGPLRPRETFEPYLSVYPLPSGEWCVLAKTWQDTTVARAGCVRTLSLIIPSSDWASAENLSPFLEQLDVNGLPQESDATQRLAPPSNRVHVAPATEFRATELLEALFLEEPRPVAVFDAPQPEVIALRLLTALWPSMRRRFSVSTFALSPRRIAGKDFDLVFAPKNARAKFSDWNGRRVDGRSSQESRHRWTEAIISRIFKDPSPRLLTSEEICLVGDGDDADNAAALRIALLWDELRHKLERTPTAALGLLDIANSGKVRNSVAICALEPALAKAVLKASLDLPTAEAWNFIGAIARKMEGQPLPAGLNAVGQAAMNMAAREPEGAVALLARPEFRDGGANLLPRIAEGMGRASEDQTRQALLAAPLQVFGGLLSSGGAITVRAAQDANLVERLGNVLPDLDLFLVNDLAAKFLPHLVEDWQAPAAAPLINRLDKSALAQEIRRLGLANDFAGSLLTDIVIKRAKKIGARELVRSELVGLQQTARRDAILAQTLDSSVTDVSWLLGAPELAPAIVDKLLQDLLRKSDDIHFSAILSDARIGRDVIGRIDTGAPDLLRRAILSRSLAINDLVRAVTVLLPAADDDAKGILAESVVSQALGRHFEGDEVDFLATMLGLIGNRLNANRIVWDGVGGGVVASVASRNMLVFRKAAPPARLRIVSAISELARALCERRGVGLDADAAIACADLMLEAERTSPKALLSAAGHILPVLMRNHNEPVSPMIAAAFPIAYRELAQASDVPDFLKFMPFFDWDRCKVARRELVSAFMSSSWPPGDLAFTAWRCGDAFKILKSVVRAQGGEGYLDRVVMDTKRLPDECRVSVQLTIAALKNDRSLKHDWRD